MPDSGGDDANRETVPTSESKITVALSNRGRYSKNQHTEIFSTSVGRPRNGFGKSDRGNEKGRRDLRQEGFRQAVQIADAAQRLVRLDALDDASTTSTVEPKAPSPGGRTRLP